MGYLVTKADKGNGVEGIGPGPATHPERERVSRVSDRREGVVSLYPRAARMLLVQCEVLDCHDKSNVDTADDPNEAGGERQEAGA